MKRAALVRKSPMKRKAAKKKSEYKTPRCVWGRCRKPQLHIERCKTHADWYLDGLRAALVRKDHCEVEHRDDRWVGKPFSCSGPIQDNHGIPRGMRRVRWLVENGLSGCSGVNIWAHQNKQAWTAYLIRHWGAEKHARIVELSVSGPLPDYEEILRTLTT